MGERLRVFVAVLCCKACTLALGWLALSVPLFLSCFYFWGSVAIPGLSHLSQPSFDGERLLLQRLQACMKSSQEILEATQPSMMSISKKRVSPAAPFV